MKEMWIPMNNVGDKRGHNEQGNKSQCYNEQNLSYHQRSPDKNEQKTESIHNIRL